jgi:eukaryotic-like serine/threonine-protein kinase
MTEAGTPQVPDFDLVRPLGEGGFGQVWLAINRTTGQPRAVKIIPRARAGNGDPAGREIASLIRLEANSRCRHPNLLVIHHVGETAEHVFYVMDLADDLSGALSPTDSGYRPATLESRLATGPLEPDECQRCAEQLLAALACLHRSGMVHRDVKPANCLFLGGELKLGDFGLLTSAGAAVSRIGTLRYMPPDGRMDARADVYAAGLVIYEMLSGLRAERFPSLGQRAGAVAEDRRLAKLNRLVLRACDPDPNRRYSDAREMLAALTGPEARPARRRLRWFAPAAIVGAAIAMAVFWPHRTEPVDVNFVTKPFEATIHIDGQLLHAADGAAYRTPCTVPGLSAGPHRVVFEWDDGSRADAGTIDFGTHRQVSARR